MSTISSTALQFAVGAAATGEKALPIERQKTTETRAQLEEVAEKFEAQLSDPLLNSEGQKTFNSMLDTEYADALAQHESLGIAEALVRQFQNRVVDGDK